MTLWRWPLAACLAVAGPPAAAKNNALAVLGGVGTERNFSETVTRRIGDLTRDRVVALVLSRTLGRPHAHLSVEGELMYARHFGRETYHEAGAALAARWDRFPWSEIVATTFAVGLGPSVTSIHPELERQNDPEDRSRLLNQFNLEMTLAPPEEPDVEVVLRLQHRSGVFGLFGGVTDASNFLTVGVRRRF